MFKKMNFGRKVIIPPCTGLEVLTEGSFKPENSLGASDYMTDPGPVPSEATEAVEVEILEVPAGLTGLRANSGYVIEDCLLRTPWECSFSRAQAVKFLTEQRDLWLENGRHLLLLRNVHGKTDEIGFRFVEARRSKPFRPGGRGRVSVAIHYPICSGDTSVSEGDKIVLPKIKPKSESCEALEREDLLVPACEGTENFDGSKPILESFSQEETPETRALLFRFTRKSPLGFYARWLFESFGRHPTRLAWTWAQFAQFMILHRLDLLEEKAENHCRALFLIRQKERNQLSVLEIQIEMVGEKCEIKMEVKGNFLDLEASQPKVGDLVVIPD
ncbi:hypothetical protein KKC60_04575 [Patescibacteria group bacterium]|nr:hypothetical protein [Patescibacteria group bacterium]